MSVCTFWELAGLESQKLISRKIWETEISWNFHTKKEEPCESDVTWGLFLNEDEVNFTYRYDYVYPRSNCEVNVTSEPPRGQRSQRHCTTKLKKYVAIFWDALSDYWVHSYFIIRTTVDILPILYGLSMVFFFFQIQKYYVAYQIFFHPFWNSDVWILRMID